MFFWLFIHLIAACGSFNAQITKFALQKRLTTKPRQNCKVLGFWSKDHHNLKSKGCEFVHEQMNCKPEDFVDIANALGDNSCFVDENAFERVVICYNEFQSVMTQEPISKQISLMQLESGDEMLGQLENIYEPTGKKY